jgi:hypothetical protein
MEIAMDKRKKNQNFTLGARGLRWRWGGARRRRRTSRAGADLRRGGGEEERRRRNGRGEEEEELGTGAGRRRRSGGGAGRRRGGAEAVEMRCARVVAAAENFGSLPASVHVRQKSVKFLKVPSYM